MVVVVTPVEVTSVRVVVVVLRGLEDEGTIVVVSVETTFVVVVVPTVPEEGQTGRVRVVVREPTETSIDVLWATIDLANRTGRNRVMDFMM